MLQTLCFMENRMKNLSVSWDVREFTYYEEVLFENMVIKNEGAI